MLRKGRRLDFRVLEEGEVAVPVEDGKGVRDRVEEAGGAGREAGLEAGARPPVAVRGPSPRSGRGMSILGAGS